MHVFSRGKVVVYLRCYTDIHQFTEENSDEMLEGTLRWAFPNAHGEMTKLVTLPNIIEEEEATGDDGCDDYNSVP